MLTISVALAAILDPIAPLEAERAALAEAAGRVAASDAAAAVDLPPFDRSAMDGYAVRSADTGAGPLRLAGEIAAAVPAASSSALTSPAATPPASRSATPGAVSAERTA